MTKRWVSGCGAIVAVLLSVAIVESGRASRLYFAFSARMTLTAASALVVGMCWIAYHGWKEKLKTSETRPEKQAVVNSLRLLVGMGLVAGSLGLYSLFFSIWWLLSGFADQAGYEWARHAEQIALQYAPYITFPMIIGILWGWGMWAMPMFEKAYGKEAYISAMITGATILFLSLFVIAQLAGLFGGPHPDMFLSR